MDRGAGIWRSVVLVAASLAVASCTTEVQHVGDPQVRVRQDQRDVLGTSKILRDGEEVGALRTLRVHGPAGTRVVYEVRDLHLNSLGYIDEKCCAYRYSAYTGSECVSSSSDRRRNVAAILGAYGANVELIEAEPASVRETDAEIRPASRRAK